MLAAPPFSVNGGAPPGASPGARLRAKGAPHLFEGGYMTENNGHMNRICVFDIEIATPVEECERGWAGAREGQCGLSALVIWDSISERYHVYDAYSLDRGVEHLNSADVLVSWNGLSFDAPCIEALTGVELMPKHIDLLDLVWKALKSKTKGYRLGEVSWRTLKLKKNGTGERAPELVEQERWADLFDYCINDVHLTRKLWEHIQEHMFIVDTEGEPLILMVPEVK